MITAAESAEAACQGWLKLIWSPDSRIQNVMSGVHIGNSLMIINGGWADKSFRLSVALQQEQWIAKLPMWAVGEDISQNHHVCILCVWCLLGQCVLRLQCVFAQHTWNQNNTSCHQGNNGVVDGKWSLMERLAELSVYVFMYFLDSQKDETSEFFWQPQSFPLEPPSCQNFNLFARKIGILIGRWWTPFNLDTPCVSCRSDLR